MDKHTVIVIIASIAIVGTIGVSVWNVLAAEQIQIKAVNEGYFSYFDLMNNGEILICNPLSMPVSFSQMQISMIYVDEKIGWVQFPGVTVEAQSEIREKGRFGTSDFKQAQYLALHFDGMYNGVIPSRIDLENITIRTEIDSLVLGFIPYSTVKQYPGLDFWFLMNDKNNDYSC